MNGSKGVNVVSLRTGRGLGLGWSRSVEWRIVWSRWGGYLAGIMHLMLNA